MVWQYNLGSRNAAIGNGLGRRRREKFVPNGQARRARSDAPYRAGRAAGLFDFIAHFGVRV